MSYDALPDDGQYDTPLASLSITHVSYDPTDPLSLLAAYLSLVPQGLMVVYAVLIFSHRELEIVLACAGQLGNEAVNYVLKRLIKEARPTDLKGKGYGMPSSHTQFMFFFATYISLWIALRNNAIQVAVKPLLLAVLPVLATAIAAARVYLHYHTTRQVLVGAGAGVVIGVGWFVATALMKGFAGGVIWDSLLENPISKALYIKDECVDVDLQRRDWEVWWAARMLGKQGLETKKQR
ncbi:Dolichyldiphosphatase [Orbilia brochopaga]|nr:Dolichyldiphosphatase [Drechslerella brochopaga]